MTLIEKINLVRDNASAVIAAINAYLDKVYSLTDSYFTEDGELKTGLTPDAKLEQFILELRNDASEFESIRAKVINNDFNLSLVEVNKIGIAFVYIKEIWSNQIKMLTKACEEANGLIKELTSSENEQID